MRKVHLGCLFVLSATACGASQRHAGEAMVVAGAVTTVVGASNASHSYCTSFGCTTARRPSRGGTNVALAGAALAAGGYALMATAPRGDVQSGPLPAALDPAANAWRLRRKSPPEPAPSAEEGTRSEDPRDRGMK